MSKKRTAPKTKTAPQIFEIFGVPFSPENDFKERIKGAQCPYMGKDCDGGGNRYSSKIKIGEKHGLKDVFSNKDSVIAGVCSIKLANDASPWIVCPRRLLVFSDNLSDSQKNVRDAIWETLGYKKEDEIKIWPEVRIQLKEEDKLLEYTFDYVVMKGEEISVIEVMTSSTSGGDKEKETTISKAFENAIIKGEHVAPNINKRQVWARMASQLIAKSQLAKHWGGKALWIIQDVLADYISKTTALSLCEGSKESNEINFLVFAYDNNNLKIKGLYSGPISSCDINEERGFNRIIYAPFIPKKSELIKKLTNDKFISIKL